MTALVAALCLLAQLLASHALAAAPSLSGAHCAAAQTHPHSDPVPGPTPAAVDHDAGDCALCAVVTPKAPQPIRARVAATPGQTAAPPVTEAAGRRAVAAPPPSQGPPCLS